MRTGTVAGASDRGSPGTGPDVRAGCGGGPPGRSPDRVRAPGRDRPYDGRRTGPVAMDRLRGGGPAPWWRERHRSPVGGPAPLPARGRPAGCHPGILSPTRARFWMAARPNRAVVLVEIHGCS
ncbi:hypothetical protein GCM10010249_41910 [Streptomyces roseolilacinus]|uniref:Uncharacterized protein n=1 Tax=Streptomyces roseolilacinus TaxID=66904 RepID=A0A918B326_9ACTN|nr:hypothetical protein GCM10010249_41910 [Streptomyces roseolilacinus]